MTWTPFNSNLASAFLTTASQSSSFRSLELHAENICRSTAAIVFRADSGATGFPFSSIVWRYDDVEDDNVVARLEHRHKILDALHDILVGPIVEHGLDHECVCGEILLLEEIVGLESNTRAKFGLPDVRVERWLYGGRSCTTRLSFGWFLAMSTLTWPAEPPSCKFMVSDMSLRCSSR